MRKYWLTLVVVLILGFILYLFTKRKNLRIRDKDSNVTKLWHFQKKCRLPQEHLFYAASEKSLYYFGNDARKTKRVWNRTRKCFSVSWV